MPDSSDIAGRGRLAEVIATRGGHAPPEAPMVIEHREALIYMLVRAAELEHSIMCEYLFAAFSMKQRLEEGLTEAELAAVLRWRRQIAHVATQEMMHLTLVQNVLSAIGGAPHLARPNLPQPADHYPAGVQLGLLPFGEQALRHFMFLERPEGMDLDDAEGMAAVDHAIPVMQPGDIVPGLQDFATVGHLYRSIELGITGLAEKLGERALFVGPPRAQAGSAAFAWPELVKVTDTASACAALEEILEQGEGARGDWKDAHFGQFVLILEELLELKAANPDFDPVRPVLVATVRPCEHDASVPQITDPVTARCADLFNVGYEVLLLALERYFAHTEETDEQLATLADLTLAMMFQVIKPLGDLITTLPAGPEYPGRTAGPTFELFYESDYLMPHREAAWFLMAERLREAAAFCVRIHTDADAATAAVLAPVRLALTAMADTLVPPDPSITEPDAGDAAWGPLLDRAAAYVAHARSASIDDGSSAEILDLVVTGHQVLTALSCGAGAERRVAVGARLVNSVLRPLAASLAPGTGTGTGVGPEPVTGPRHEPIDEQMWALAMAATRLRAERSGPPGLLEATAALQHLALRLAPPDVAGERGAELRMIQAGLPAGIQSAPDGPYLVTNAAGLIDWLGTPIATRPQMALCRCGGSASKPFCDGTHVRIGFTAHKAAERVPDRRDTYVGEQVTILDNRGVCAHSGFCTDRLASVFHVGEEPFVTPSGGRMDDVVRAVRDCPSGALSFAIGAVEARDQVDQQRDPAIEVSKDGPYRVTGGMALLDGDGVDEIRNEGASREHYSLCRCGSSQNKPFCSGVHWYVDFHDPPFPPHGREPTLFEWAGGYPALLRTTRMLYGRHVPQDTLLGPLFADMGPDHPERVAAWLGEVFGGPPAFTDFYGGDPGMVSGHGGSDLTEAHRSRWVTLMCRSADDAKLPADAEFRAALVGYLEWASRVAVESSATAGVSTTGERSPVPSWTWAGRTTPGARRAVSATEPDVDEPVVLPADDEPVSFAAHIKPLFRERDRRSMSFAFDLWLHPDVAKHAIDVLARIADGSMPCDGAWPPEKVAVFRRWVEAGAPE